MALSIDAARARAARMTGLASPIARLRLGAPSERIGMPSMCATSIAYPVSMPPIMLGLSAFASVRHQDASKGVFAK
ncbi:hypothetical protein A8H35_25600 [Burkholderia thailandensis]|nr:hypothetical protein A8H31_05880 [Burkholderia thailandensis]AWY61531.1 hypothetical protein A8H35_25600 [Burkholderia thailandensis]PHH34895.1 hypothetical protein CRX59_30855 [Burkholderia thailandensis]PNE71277.1 hypothetical protein A8H38_03215 [Burkholderia thailandensis]PNE83177.1 hypothetical protein A8H34_02670 [Burkholderia thailandensis]